MDWMEIVSALTLIAFIFMMYPTAKEMIKSNPRGTSADWMGFIIPLVVIVLFVIFLVILV